MYNMYYVCAVVCTILQILLLPKTILQYFLIPLGILLNIDSVFVV